MINKALGIFMDHSSAHILEYTHETMETKTIESKFTHFEKEESWKRSENLMHNKQQHEQHDFYKKLEDVILKYERVILFGPTNAKSELHNLLKKDHRFANIEVEVEDTDKMTENQQHAFVRNYFSTVKSI